MNKVVLPDITLNYETGFMERRDALKLLLAISAAGAAACSENEESPRTSEVDKLTLSHMATLTAVVDTIIPTTDTPGAVEAAVPETLSQLVSEWGDESFRRYWINGLTALGQDLAKIGGQSFSKMSAKARENLLAQYDADVYAGKVQDSFYKDMKATAATAYYMSEPGATQELRYEAVPGEWKGCVPFEDIGRTWAT